MPLPQRPEGCGELTRSQEALRGLAAGQSWAKGQGPAGWSRELPGLEVCPALLWGNPWRGGHWAHVGHPKSVMPLIIQGEQVGPFRVGFRGDRHIEIEGVRLDEFPYRKRGARERERERRASEGKHIRWLRSGKNEQLGGRQRRRGRQRPGSPGLEVAAGAGPAPDAALFSEDYKRPRYQRAGPVALKRSAATCLE